MSENKDYISHLQKNGTVHISEEVIASVAGAAALEVEGVCGLSGNPGIGISELISKKGLSHGVHVSVNEQKQAVIDCFVIAYLGHSVLDVARTIQDAVRDTVTSVTGLTVTKVNVTITGVVLPRGSRQQ